MYLRVIIFVFCWSQQVSASFCLFDFDMSIPIDFYGYRQVYKPTDGMKYSFMYVGVNRSVGGECDAFRCKELSVLG